MSDEQFLARWSRRKQEAKGNQAPAAPEGAAEVHESASSDRVAAEPIPVETKLSNLPPIESIDAATDITAFLRKGIPPELSRAALRRAWSADPAIRDFVGLAENAWDFNDPNAVTGFGPLDYSAEQVDALVRRIVGDVAETAESLPNPIAAAAEDTARSAHAETGSARPSNAVKTTEPQLSDEAAAAELTSGSAASHPGAAGNETPLPRRNHGGALPR
jgi:Protein of unknown function (DUF3306)